MKVVAVSHSAVVSINCCLYEELGSRPGWEVSLVVPERWPSEYGGPDHKPEPGEAFKMHPLPVFKAGSIPLHGYRSDLGRVLRIQRPDVVFLDEEPYSVAAAQTALLCRSHQIPFVLYTKQNLLKRYPPPFGWMERWVLSAASSVLSLTAEVEAVVRAKGRQQPGPLFPHAVDFSRILPACGQSISKSHGLRGPVIGYLGRLTEAKGIDIFAEALVLAADAKWAALVVGSGPAEERLRERLMAAGLAERVIFSGAVGHDQAAGYLRAMDLLVVPSRTTPSWKEQFGRVIIEALACGVPVIGSDSGHIPSLLHETGGGWIFPEGDAVALAAALREALASADECRKRGAAGERVVRERYSYPALADRLADILTQACCAQGVRSAASAGASR